MYVTNKIVKPKGKYYICRIHSREFFNGLVAQTDFNKIDKNLEKELKTKIKTEKTIITIQFNQNDYDTIIDPKFTAGFLLATNKNTIFNNLIDIKKNYKINLKNLNSFYPVFLSIDFIYKPQTIIYFLLLSDFLKDKFINKQLTYISELQQPLKGKSEMLEINRTSILYKINNKLLYKNIDINEVFPYKNQIEIDNIKISENNLLYIIILIILYSSKIIFFMMLKNK